MLPEIQTLRDMYREYSNAELADNEEYAQTIHNLALLLDMQEIDRITQTDTCPWCHQDY